jgi:replicative DNA helicase
MKPTSNGQDGALAPILGRVPPNAPDAERGVLSCVLTDQTTFPEVHRKIGRDGDAFFDLRHRKIWEVACTVIERTGTIDTLALFEELRALGQVDAVGGMVYLNEIIGATPSSANHPYYCEILRERRAARMVLRSLAEAEASIYSGVGPWDEVAGSIESSVGQACQSAKSGEQKQRSLHAQIQEAVDMMEELLAGPAGFLSGFPSIDKLTMGFKSGELIVVPARPGNGKTALCLNMIRNNLFGPKQPVGVFSLEMPAGALLARMSGAISSVDTSKPQWWTEVDYAKVTDALASIGTLNMLIDDTPGISIVEMRARAREMKRQIDVKVIFVDYIQLVEGSSRKAQFNRQVEVGEVATGLKRMARELGIPVIAGCAMNRQSERENRAKPRMSDLRESGNIEADADTILGLYRMAKTEEESQKEDAAGNARIGVIPIKQRNGMAGQGIVVPLMFNKLHQRFEEMSRVET